MSLGTWLSQLRKSQRLTTQTLASKIGIDDGNLSRVENDRIQPTLQTVVAICDGLGIKSTELYVELVGKDYVQSVREQAEVYNTSTSSLEIADIYNWLDLWHRNSLHAHQTLSRLLLEVHAHMQDKDNPSIDSTMLDSISFIFRRSPAFQMEINYPPSEMDSKQVLTKKLAIAYTQQALFTFDDVSFCLRKVYTALSKAEEQPNVLIESKLREGLPERIKFSDVVDFDRELKTSGNTIGMFWLAAQYRIALDRKITKTISENTRHRSPLGTNVSEEEPVAQIDALTRILVRLCRWKQLYFEDDADWLSRFRQDLSEPT